MKRKKLIVVGITLLVLCMSYFLSLNGKDLKAFATTTDGATIQYRSHIQNLGWGNYEQGDGVVGTTGKALRLEAIQFNIINNPNLQIRYSTFVQGLGWQDYKNDGQVSGTEGQSKMIEAVKIELFGAASKNYDILYRVHVENFGWLDWTKNGNAAGSEGFGFRIEAIEIRLYNKDNGPSTSSNALVHTKNYFSVRYQSHVENYAWMSVVADGNISGTEGKALRLEAFKVVVSPYLPSGSVNYTSYVQGIGWQDPVKDGSNSGTTGQAMRIEATKMWLTGQIAEEYGIEYRTHIQDIGWTGWKHDGEISGAGGSLKRIEALEIRLYNKAVGPTPTSSNDPADPVVPTDPVDPVDPTDPVDPVDPVDPTPEPVYLYSIYAVNASAGLRLRSVASTSGAILATMPYGSQVKVYSIDSNQWAKVDYGTLSGYAAATYLVKKYDVYSDMLPLVFEMTPMKSIYTNEDVIGSGYAIGYTGIESITITLDGNPIPVLRSDRIDLAAQYPAYPVMNQPGFTFNINKADLSVGNHVIKVTVKTNSGFTETKTFTWEMAKDPSIVTLKGLTDLAPVPTEPTTLTGVALSPEGVSNVNIYINGVLQGAAIYGLPSDGSAYTKYPGNTTAGYTYNLQPGLMSKAMNTVKVEVVGKDGSKAYDAVILKGTSTDLYVNESYAKTFKTYVDMEYKNVQIYTGSGPTIYERLWQNMDPSNFIYDDTNKYLFLDLSYNVEDYDVPVELLDSMLAGKGVLSGKGQVFLDAAKAYGVNPFYLVAHSLLETGNGTSQLARGVKIEVVYSKIGDINSPTTPVPPENADKFYHNVFGIRAYDGNAVLWGSQYAYSVGWDSVDKAIEGGVKWIADNYINRLSGRQNTLYKMRFNIAGSMTHQYATDIEWAFKQAKRIKDQFDVMGVTAVKKFCFPIFLRP